MEASRADLAVGDYLVYDLTQATSVPAGVAPRAYRTVVSYYQIAADGTSRRVQTVSDAARIYQTFNVNAALLSQDVSLGGSGVVCAYAPGLQTSPPYPRSVGQTWNTVSSSACSSAPNVQSGEVKAREVISVPAGSFDAYRADRQSSTTQAGMVLTQDLVCWYSVTLGHLLRCDFTNRQTPVGGSVPTQVASYTQALSAIGGLARVPVGNTLARFQGSWRVTFQGGNTGTCSALAVSAVGVISGSCTIDNVGVVAITGSVNGAGAVTASLAGGGMLTGNLTTPYAGSGTWADTSLSGTWTASHH